MNLCPESINACWLRPSARHGLSGGRKRVSIPCSRDRIEVLSLLIQEYEREHYPIPDPEPIDFLLHVMDARGLTRKDMEPFIGSRARVAEVLNRVRPLSLEMIRRLSTGLGIPAEVLIQPYAVTRAA